MHDSLKWLTVKQRSNYVLTNFIRNILVTKSPKTLYRKFSARFARGIHQTRYATEGRFILPKANYNIGQKTVAYRGMVKWNAIPLHIVKEQSKDRFKMVLKQYLIIFYEVHL